MKITGVERSVAVVAVAADYCLSLNYLHANAANASNSLDNSIDGKLIGRLVEIKA